MQVLFNSPEARSASFCGGGPFNPRELGTGGIDTTRTWKVGVHIAEIDCHLCVGDEFRNCTTHDRLDRMGTGTPGISQARLCPRTIAFRP